MLTKTSHYWVFMKDFSSNIVYDVRVLKHFSPWGIISSEGIETFLDKNCLIFLVKIFKSIQHKNYTWVDIFQNLNKFCAQNVSIPLRHILPTNTFTNIFTLSLLPSTIRYISFFSSFDMQTFHHLFGCQAIGINSSLIYF